MGSTGSECLAVVPARGGSTGIRDKNLVQLGDRPLIAWTLAAAHESKRIDRVVVTTDSERIAATARELGAEVPFLRKPNLARHDVHAVHTVLDALNRLNESEGYQPDLVTMLLPTAPFRRGRHIDGSLELLESRGGPAVIGVFRWDRYLTNLRFLRGGTLVPVEDAPDFNVQRQDQEDLYVVNGAIFGAKKDVLLNLETFHVPGALGYVMDREESVDINDSRDLAEAHRLLEGRGLIS